MHTSRTCHTREKMGQQPEIQRINTDSADRVGNAASRTRHAADAPVFLTKKWLAMSKDCYMASCGKVNYQRLNRLVFTDQVLDAIGITREQLKGVRDFDLVTSNKLKKILDL